MIDPRRLRRLSTSIRVGIRGVRTAPLVFGAAVVTMAAGLSLLSGYLLVLQNMRGVLDRFGEDLRVVVYFAPGAEPAAADRDRIEAQILAHPAVGEVRYFSTDAALERLRRDLGREASVLEGLEHNPLPASFEVRLRSAADLSSGGDLAEALGALPGVDEVRWGEDWVRGYARVVGMLEAVGLVLGALLLVLLATIVAGTVRLALHARADEIRIQRLVGAGGLFVRLPFYLEGALEGGIAAALSLAVLFAAFQVGLPVLDAPLRFVLGPAEPVFFGTTEIVALVLIGVGLGVGGCAISLARLEERP